MTTYAPPVEAVEALADAVHDQDDSCNANYYIAAESCPFRVYDREQAAAMLVALHKDGWALVRHGGGTVELGL